MADFAGAPKSFAAQFEIPNDENISFPSAYRLVAQCEAAQLQTRAIIEEKPEGLTKFIDLPVDFAGNKKQMHHLVDAIKKLASTTSSRRLAKQRSQGTQR